MILMKTNDCLQGAESIRKAYILLCNSLVTKLLNSNDIRLLQLLKIYSLNDIRLSINNITINNKGDIISPEHTRFSKILRYLEYGGDSVKSMHLLSKTTNIVCNTFSMRRRNS